MAAAEIQVVNPSNLAKIESFLNDPSYKEIIENSSTFNSRLCAERRMRMPFIDTQTGVAQSHCNLFMTRKQRMPGAREGQVYTYPSQRWRKARRQYLTMSSF
ncbi:Zinc finger protein ubi-d4 A [Papilio machaon]|uniref:Zinc finger protein ubi-d4 A n=1 Tax=Papilio machaon TaxID=76193 RepID=A0A0N1IJQ6_PAPMA|nr:Zinc finger protein ubi-d4 A [Papilio machaon]